jgi:hypothetical protein
LWGFHHTTSRRIFQCLILNHAENFVFKGSRAVLGKNDLDPVGGRADVPGQVGALLLIGIDTLPSLRVVPTQTLC